MQLYKGRIYTAAGVLAVLCLMYLLKQLLKHDAKTLPYQTQNTSLREFYCSNGARVVFKTVEPTSGGWFVLVHGLDSSFASWEKVSRWLEQFGYGLLLVDLPNHGMSRAPHTPPTTIDHMAQTLDELLQALEIRTPMFLAHSMGALVVLKLHALLHKRGDTPKKTYLVNPVLRVPPKYKPLLTKALPVYALLQNEPHDKLTNHMDYSRYFFNEDQDLARRLTRFFTIVSVTWEQFEKCLREMMSIDAESLLQHANLTSTVVVYGTKDFLQEETLDLFGSRVQSIYEVEGHGHQTYSLDTELLHVLVETTSIQSDRHEFERTFSRHKELGLGHGVCWQK